MTLPDATLAAFSFFNLLRLGSYLPQLWRIARDDHGATAISYATWGTWIGANASTTAYAWVNLGDDWLALVNGVNTGCCVGVCALTAWKRRSWRREQAARLQTSGFAPQCSPADRRRR
ncbi:MAG: hypothetical protein O9345_14060 [Burkholderiaceae bacterium]|jgi:hypothetical protein|nr:hypothetical protein [Burkholderiales bacterium]MCZ8107396.1 hypothetical protein [Burkholderiales bacterium]MCZ8339252.1 hypothetical protein [Burkholderiaceae bacterium]